MDTTVDKASLSHGAELVAQGSAPKELTILADRVRDALLTWAQSRFGEDEFVRAKEEFFWRTGKVFHDDNFYEARMEYFIDYFLLERPLSTPYDGELCLTPFETYQRFVDSSLLSGIGEFRHALFQINKVGESKLTVLDLINDEKIEILARPWESFRAIIKKELVQGFVYSSEQKFYLSQGTIFHPMKANRFIKKEIKKAKNTSEFEVSGFLCALAKLQLRHLRHAHVDPRRIYCQT